MNLRAYLQSPRSAQHALLLLVGALHSLSFAPGPLPTWALPYVQIGCLAYLAKLTLQSESGRQVALGAWLFGLANFAVGLYWVTISMHEFGGMPLVMAIAALLIFAAALSLYGTLACFLAWRLLRPRVRFDPGVVIWISAVWAACWTFGEWLRGTLFTGFPWLNIAYAQVEGVYAPWAAVLGVYGVTWLSAFASAAVGLAILGRRSGREVQAAVGIAISLLLGVAGIALSHAAWSRPFGDPILVRLVQGNIPQSQKFDPALIERGIADYLMMARLAPKDGGRDPDLIVLPETVVPLLQHRVQPQVWQSWIDVARERQSTLLMGVPLFDRLDGRNRYTNSTIVVSPESQVDAIVRADVPRYDKFHLVPFGEFIPSGFRWFVDMMDIPLGDFDRGALSQTALPIAGQRVAPNICYEDVFGEEIIQSVQGDVDQGGASILVNVSNLAWFGNSWALRQHLQIARMRSIETARPMLRATNTGMTAAISPTGLVWAALDPHVKGVLDVEVQGTAGLTPYAQWSNWPVVALSLLLLATAMLPVRKSASNAADSTGLENK